MSEVELANHWPTAGNGSSTFSARLGSSHSMKFIGTSRGAVVRISVLRCKAKALAFGVSNETINHKEKCEYSQK